MTIQTERLRLVAGTASLVRAEIENREEFARLLGAFVPESWPPETLVDALPVFRAELESNPDHVGWWCWYALASGDSAGEHQLVGGVGLKGAPVDGVLEIGYSVLPEFQCRGYATEMVHGLVEWAMSQPGVDRIIAQTEWANPASVRVLHKAGFTQIEDKQGSDGARFELVKGSS